MKVIHLFLVGLAVASCTSSPQKPENQPDVVIERIDGLETRPKWLQESKPFLTNNDEVIALGSTILPSDNRVDAGFRIAENEAKRLVATSIEQRLNFVFQHGQEGTSLDSNQTRYIGEEASKLTSSSLRPKHRYYEKVATTLDSGERVTRYKVFAAVSMPLADFKKAIFQAAKKAEGGAGVSKEFEKKLDESWDKFVSETK